MSDQTKPNGVPVLTLANRGKQVIAAVLLALMFLVVAVATVELVIVVFKEVGASIQSPSGDFVLSETGLFGIFGLFLNVLIAVELIETVEVYFREHALHAETVLLVAIIAVARKAILLDLSHYEPLMVIALGGLIVALGAGYYLIQRSCHL